MNGASLGPGAEFDAIRALLEQWGSLAIDIGDDAAVLAPPRGEQLVVSVDTAVENRHFRRDWLSPNEIAYRAVTAALSDLAAMGARPTGILIGLVVPDTWRSEIAAIGEGIAVATRNAGTTIRGGNLTAGSELSITTTVLGSTYRPLRRNGATTGDRIYVTGTLGAPGAALRRLLADRDAGPFRERFAHPVARLAEGQWLAREGATAAIDISDGLFGDLRHLATANAATFAIDAAALPGVETVGLTEILESGEEYELIVTSPQRFDVDAFRSRFGIPLTEIGRVEAGEPGVVRVDGARVANVASHDHFIS